MLTIISTNLIALHTFDPTLAEKYKADVYGVKFYLGGLTIKMINGRELRASEMTDIFKYHMVNIQ